MGAMSLSHIVVVVALVVLLFGRGKVSELLGDLGKGIRSFKKGIAEDNEERTHSTFSNDQDGQGAPEVTREKAGERA